jgi:uncharacterized Ntn-hydrolase superfamily protein
MTPKLEIDGMEVEYEVVSIDDVDDYGDIIDREYVDVEVDDYDDEVEEVEKVGLQLWDRVGRGEDMMLDRETLMDVFGENEYDTY